MADFSLYELCPELPPLEVLDVGAFQNPLHPWPYLPLMEAGRARVTGFEPNFDACLRLGLAYRAPHRFFPLCVGDGKPATFYGTNRIQTGSLFEPNSPLLKVFHALDELTTVTATQEVKTIRLDDMPDLTDCDYLKIDVQGSELAALQGGEQLLESVVMVETEVAFEAYYRDQPLFAEVDGYLRSRGFWLHYFPAGPRVTFNPFESGGKQMLWTDAVYTRHPQRLGAVPEAKLWKLAVLLHDLHGSCDFAHACLREIDARAGTGVAHTYRARLTPESWKAESGKP